MVLSLVWFAFFGRGSAFGLGRESVRIGEPRLRVLSRSSSIWLDERRAGSGRLGGRKRQAGGVSVEFRVTAMELAETARRADGSYS